MQKYDKTVIAPIISLIALAVGAIFHISLDEDVQGMVTEALAAVIAVGITLYGIVKNHKK